MTDEALLDERRDTLLLAISRGKYGYGLAWADSSSGRLRANEVAGEDALEAELARLQPVETLLADEDGWPACALKHVACADVHRGCSMPIPAAANCCNSWCGDLTAFGIEDRPLAIAAAAAAGPGIEETQKQRLPHLRSIALETSDDAIAMNAATRRHLELDSRVDGDVKATLLGVVGLHHFADGWSPVAALAAPPIA